MTTRGTSCRQTADIQPESRFRSFRNQPLTCTLWVELRGLEPLTPSLRTGNSGDSSVVKLASKFRRDAKVMKKARPGRKPRTSAPDNA
jgi:hypothetical protein